MSDERDDAVDALARAHGDDPDQLRREISRFRLALDADLTIAAAAAEEGAPSVAAEVLAADVGSLPGFERGLRTRVAEAVRGRRPAHPRRTPRRRGAAIAAAAGMVGLVGGAAIAATAVGSSGPAPAAVPASSTGLSPAQTLAVSQAGTLTYAADHRLPTPTILAASGALRATLLALMAQAPNNTTLASQLRSLLTSQRAALSSVVSPDPQVAAAIRSTDSLLTQLAAGATAAAPTASTSSGPSPAAGVTPSPTSVALPPPSSSHAAPAPGPSLTPIRSSEGSGRG